MPAQRDQPVMVGDGRVEIVPLKQHERAGFEGLRHVGVEFEGLVVVRERGVELALNAPDRSALEISLGEVRLGLQRLVEVRERPFQIPFRPLGDPAVEVVLRRAVRLLRPRGRSDEGRQQKDDEEKTSHTRPPGRKGWRGGATGKEYSTPIRVVNDSGGGPLQRARRQGGVSHRRRLMRAAPAVLFFCPFTFCLTCCHPSGT